MSEFKFSCPVCGQHLECDDSLSGSSIQCPACHNGITATNPLHGSLQPTSGPVQVCSTPNTGHSQCGDSALTSKTSGFAKASLISSIAGVVLPFLTIPGIICGHLAKRQINQDSSLAGRQLAKAGLIVGYTILSITVGMILLFVTVGKRSVTARAAAQERLCHIELKLIDGLREPILFGRFDRSRDRITMKELEARWHQFYPSNTKFPKCRAGGTYSVTENEGQPTCSIHGTP